MWLASKGAELRSNTHSYFRQCRTLGFKRRLWRKIHIGIGEQTLEVRAIEVTSSIGDAPMLPDLLNQIPPRKNAKLWKPDTRGARARNEAVRSTKYLGRALGRHLTGYYRRSRVETKMHCVKLLGQSLSVRDFD